MKDRYIIWLLLILVLSIIVRTAIISYEWVDTDEGNYLYDAKLLLDGSKPFEDFYLKDVTYIAILGVFGKIFGFSLFLGRILSVLFSIITIFFIYKIGALLYNKRIGIIACGVYAFMPFTLFWNSIIRDYILMLMLVTIAFYFLIRLIKTERLIYAVFNALFLFLALLTRRSMIVFILIEIIFLIYMYKDRINFLLKILLFGFFGIVLPLLLLFFYSHIANVSFLKLLGFEFTPYSSAASWQQFFGLRAVFPYWFFREASYISVLIFIALFFWMNKKIQLYLLWLVFSIFLLSAIIVNYLVINYTDRMSQYPITSNTFFIVSIFCILILFLLVHYKIKSNFYVERPNNLVLLWFLSVVVFYFFYSRLHGVYLAESMAAASLLVAPLLYGIWKERTFLDWLFLCGLLCCIILSIVFYVNYHGISNKWSQSTVNEIAYYIKEGSNENDEIFTPLVFLPIMADRGLALNITHPLYYHFEGIGDRDMVGAPSFKTIIDYLERNKVKYVVDHSLMDITYYYRESELKEYIENNYELQKRIGDTSILIRKSEF